MWQPTLDDVAADLGLSKSTVARALREERAATTLAKATWDRVHEAASRLGYRSHRLATALARRRAGCIGLATGVASPQFQAYSGRILATLAARLAAVDESLHFIAASGVGDTWVRHLQDGRIDGCIVMQPAPPALAEVLTAARVPVVLANILLPGLRVAQVAPDDAQGMALAVDHLVGLGHRRIAWVIESRSDRTHHSVAVRLEAYRRRMRAAGCAAIELDAPAAQLAEALSGAGAPTAAVIYSDRDLLRIHGLLAARGVRIPADLAVVCFNDDVAAAELVPGFTAVDTMPVAVAERALAVLRGEAEGGLVPTRLVVRASTAGTAGGPAPR